MKDRFKLNAIVKGYYFIDAIEKTREYEPLIFLSNVDALNYGDIGISEEDLIIEIKKQYPNLSNKNVKYIIDYFKDNSAGTETYITITPEKKYQSTGLKDKHGNLIFEGDIIKEKWYSKNEKKFRECLYFVEYDEEKMAYCFVEVDNGFKNFFVDMEFIQDDYEIIGNIYQNEELLGGTNDNI